MDGIPWFGGVGWRLGVAAAKTGQVFAMAAAVFLSGLSPVVAQSASLEGWSYDNLAAAVDRLEGKLDRVRESVDQTRFEPDELVFSLDFDGEAIVAFANDEIAFHPYRGLLRGVAGTLQSRAGNALDQSLLLAYLLKTAGLDARIVRAELSEAQAARLLDKTRRPARSHSLAKVEAAIREAFGEEAPKASEAVALEKTPLKRRAEAAAASLASRLADAGKAPDAGKLNAGLVSRLREYFWVEYRMGPGEEWATAHPAFGSDPGFELEPEEYMADEIPEQYHHRLTMEAFLRQRVGDKYKSHRVMKAFTRPVANLHGVVLAYRNHPSGVRPETLDDLAGALAGDQILMPIFGGGLAPGARAFDLKGRTVDPMVFSASAGGAAGLFSTLSDKMEAATSTMKDPDNPESVFELDSMWLEFTYEPPGGEQVVQRRYLLPPPGEKGRETGDLIWPLITEYAYVVNAGGMPLDYLADRYLATGIESLATYKALAHKMIEPEAGTPLPRDEPPRDFGPLALYEIMGADPLAPGDIVPVRHRPAVVGLKRGLRDAETAFTAVDIVFNDQLLLGRTDEGVRHDPVAALRRGVWETAVETVPGRVRGDEVIARLNTMTVFDAAREQGIAIRVLPAGDMEAAEALEMDAGERALLVRDLAAGYTVVAPAATPEGVAMSGWWRVDPVSGTALGMTADGHGQDAVEYVMELIMTSMGLINAIGGLSKCAKEPTNVAQACCLLEAHINNVTGLAFGGVLGSQVSTATVAIFEIANTGVTEATDSGILPEFELNCEGLRNTAF